VPPGKGELFLKGLRCFTDKCALEKRNFVPGQQWSVTAPKSPDTPQLREKQVKRTLRAAGGGNFLT